MDLMGIGQVCPLPIIMPDGRLATRFRYGHVLRSTFSWRLPSIIHVKLSHYILATKLRFKYGCFDHPSAQNIQSIYLSGKGLEGFYPKQQVYDMLAQREEIRVNIYPYPMLKEMTNVKGKKYVRSMPNGQSAQFTPELIQIEGKARYINSFPSVMFNKREETVNTGFSV